MKFLILSVCIACSYAATFYQTGQCPYNHVAGERWNPVGGCMECYCDQTGYGCSSCGIITPIIGCYQLPVDTSKQYPECCPRLECPPAVPTI